MKVEKNQVVAINYTLKNDAGEVLDTSEGHEPLYYIQGIGNIIPGLESALEGKTIGDRVQVTIEPNDGYGDINDDLIQAVPRENFGETEGIEVGMQFEVQTQTGPLVVVVDEVGENEITVNGNHPLAGVRLHFDVTVEKIRAASEEEMSHGHVHGAGGVDH
jgi:FKBP-type peptidyl-prolyl cis-trans isomerase SlyD